MKIGKKTKVAAAIAGASVVSVVALAAAGVGGGWLRPARAPARGPNVGGEPPPGRAGPGAPVVLVDATALGLAAVKLAQASGPGSMSASGIGEGQATRRPDGSYTVRWKSLPVFVTKKRQWPIQYRDFGGDLRLEVRDRMPSEQQARWWLDAMARGASAGPKVWSDAFYQGSVVFPAPPTKASIFECVGTFPAPGSNPAKNVACGRYPEQRGKIWVAVHKVQGGYVGGWPFGSLAAGPDLELVKSAMLAAVEQINTYGRDVSGAV
jgi:hypothetical protein